jgi:hypothetical protein
LEIRLGWVKAMHLDWSKAKRWDLLTESPTDLEKVTRLGSE